MTYTGAVVTV